MSKITAYTALTAEDDPGNDVVPVVDTDDTSMASSGTTKKITVSALLSAITSANLPSLISGKQFAGTTGSATVNTSASGAVTLNVASANVFKMTLTGAVTFTFSGAPSAGVAAQFTLYLIQDGTGGRAVTWPGSVTWLGGTPSLSTAGGSVSVLTFETLDGGTTWYGAASANPLPLPLAVANGGTGSATRNFAGLLTPTAVKTAGYTAAAGDFVPCDTTSGGFTVTLPNAPADLAAVGVKQVIQGGTNTVTVACSGSDVFNKTGGGTTLTLTLLAQGAILQYQASAGIWFVQADDLPLSQLDGRVGGISFPQAPFASGKHGPIPVQPAKVITEFQSGHGYTNNAGNTFTANDTADFIMGTQACKIVTGGAGATANVSNLAQTAFSTVSKVIRLRLKVDDITHMAGLNFFLGSSSLANNYKWIIQGGAAGSNFVVSGQWLVVTLNWHDAVVTGSPSRSSITDVRLQVSDDNTSNAVTVHYQSVELVQDCSAVFPNGVVSVCFDDSYESMYTLAMPKLTQYGYPAQVFTIQSLIGGSQRLTLAQLKSLQDQLGWALSSHAYLDADHALTLTGMTAAQADLDMRQVKAWGDANGFRASAGFAYPKGQYGLTTDSQATTDVLRPYMNYARTTNSKTKETFPPADPYRLRAISDISSFSGGYAPANLTTATTGDLDVCKNNQTWLILTFHNIVAASPAATTDILQSDFNAIVDAVNAKGIPVLTVEDVLRSLDQTYPVASVTLDSTLADILPASTQASSLGSTGKPVDAGHAHPRYDWQPSDHGLATWAFDPAVAVSTSSPLANAGTLNVVRLHLPVAQNITNILLYLSTAGATLTSGQCFAALYQGGNLLGTTADQAAAWVSTGLKTMAISGGAVAAAAGDVYVAFWYNGTTGPAPLRANGNAAVNLNLGATVSRFGTTSNTGLTTTAPGTLGTVAGASVGYWAALS